MALSPYLAMTAGEILSSTGLPEGLAYMACHFSPYATGLSNLPRELPPGTLLILNDRTPIHGHDPALVCAQLEDTVQKLRCSGVLLDFQRPDCPELQALCQKVAALPCPVAVSHLYAGELSCPVFLPPPPLHQPLEEHLAPWQGRQIWLEAATDAEEITVTPEGSGFRPLPPQPQAEACFVEDALCCRYRIAISSDAITFRLFRTREDVDALLKKAHSLGVSQAVGLYQDLG